MIAVTIGIFFIFFGAWGMLRWFPDLMAIFRGVLPFSLFLGGIVALMAGVSALQRRRGDDKPKQ